MKVRIPGTPGTISKAYLQYSADVVICRAVFAKNNFPSVQLSCVRRNPEIEEGKDVDPEGNLLEDESFSTGKFHQSILRSILPNRYYRHFCKRTTYSESLFMLSAA
jgi:hypothetical protein